MKVIRSSERYVKVLRKYKLECELCGSKNVQEEVVDIRETNKGDCITLGLYSNPYKYIYVCNTCGRMESYSSPLVSETEELVDLKDLLKLMTDYE